MNHERLVSHEAERHLLGIMLTKPSAIEAILDAVDETDFHDPANQIVFSHIKSLSDAGLPVEVASVVHSLRSGTTCDMSAYEAAGGFSNLSKIVAEAPLITDATYYVGLVKHASSLRKLMLLGDQMARAVQAPKADVKEIIRAAEDALDAIEFQGVRQSVVTAKVAVDATMEEIRRARESGGSTGLFIGFEKFDREIGGLFPGELVVLAARPSMGKTAIALNIATNIIDRGGTVLVCSLEMGQRQVVDRLLAAKSDIDIRQLRNARLDDREWGMLSDAAQIIGRKPLYIDDSSHQTVGDIRRRARRLRRELLKLLVVDYIGLIGPRDPKAARWLQVAQITADLKALARELQIPVLALCQLNRESEGTKDHKPRLSQLRESGSTEQDADVVMFIHREEYYEPDDVDARGKGELIVAKNRNGPTGSFSLLWNAPTATFSSPSSVSTGYEDFDNFNRGIG